MIPVIDNECDPTMVFWMLVDPACQEGSNQLSVGG